MKHTAILTLEQAACAARRRVCTGGVAVGALLAGLGSAALFAPMPLGVVPGRDPDGELCPLWGRPAGRLLGDRTGPAQPLDAAGRPGPDGLCGVRPVDGLCHPLRRGSPYRHPGQRRWKATSRNLPNSARMIFSRPIRSIPRNTAASSVLYSVIPSCTERPSTLKNVLSTRKFSSELPHTLPIRLLLCLRR